MLNTIVTSDFYETAFLVSSGKKISGHKRDDRGRVSFEFKGNRETEDLIRQYHRMTAMVNPLEYSNAIRYLKRLLYDHIPVNTEKIENVKHTEGTAI